MSKNREAGTAGEQEVIARVPCPNCGKKLTALPVNYPLCDVQCSGCHFRTQVKTTSNKKPTSTILGAGWQIMDKVLKAGFLMPPLILNFKWQEKGVARQEIRFYPFLPKKNLRKYKLSTDHPRANYEMFYYIGLDLLPHFVLYKK